VSEHSFF
jgi:hypothetical protein